MLGDPSSSIPPLCTSDLHANQDDAKTMAECPVPVPSTTAALVPEAVWPHVSFRCGKEVALAVARADRVAFLFNKLCKSEGQEDKFFVQVQNQCYVVRL